MTSFRPVSSAAAPGADGREGRDVAALHDFLCEKHPRWPAEAVLCLAAWATDTLGQPGVSTRDLRAFYGWRGVRALMPRLLSPSDTLRMCERGTLLEPAAPPSEEDAAKARGAATRATTRYRLTDRGRAVVDALPGQRLVGVVGVVRGFARSVHSVRRGLAERQDLAAE
jgi:hypothetical protein